MNGIEFYDAIRGLFPGKDDLLVACYVNPLLNRLDHFPDTLFVLPDGSLPAPEHRFYPANWVSPSQILVAEPLSGPFYRLQVVGLEVRFVRNGEAVVSSVSAVVEFPDGTKGNSQFIHIFGDHTSVAQRIKGGFAEILNITIDELVH